MDGDAGDLAGGVEALERRAPPDVGVDAAHVVVRAGPDRDRLEDGIHAGEGHRELARSVQPVEDPVRSEVPQVEHDVAVDPAALVDLRLLGARDDVARGELHRVRGIAEEEALALGVQQVRAFPAATLGDEHSRRRQRRRVELHHLHVLERDSRAERHGHPVSGARIGIRRSGVQATCASRGEDHRLRPDRVQAAVEEVPRDHALAAVVVQYELPREELLVRLDVPLHDLLVEDVDENVSRDVRRVRGPRLAGGAERALRDLAVLGAREHRSPVLELVDVVRRLLTEDLDRVLVSEVVGALHGVEGVLLGVVLGGVPERRVDPALGRAGVAADRVDLRDHRHVRPRVEGLDRCAHARAAGPDDEHVVLRYHVCDAT